MARRDKQSQHDYKQPRHCCMRITKHSVAILETAGCRCQCGWRRSHDVRADCAAGEFAGQRYIKCEQGPNGIARRQVIFVVSDVINAVVFERARETTRQWLPTTCLSNELTRRHRPHEIA